MNVKQVLSGVAVLVGGAALFGLAQWWHQPAAPAGEDEAAPTVVTVQTGRLGQATLHGYVEGFGAVTPAPAREGQPPAAARVAARAGGVVLRTSVVEGQQVEAGAVLMELDPRAADVAAQRAQAGVEHARQVLALQTSLIATQNTSRRNLEDAQAQLAAAEADLAAAQTQRAWLRVTAPLAGTVTRLNVRPGEAVDLTSIVAEIVDESRLVVAGQLPSAAAPLLRAGQAVQVLTQPPMAARLGFVSPTVDGTNDTVLVHAALPATAGLRPGQLVRFRIVTAEHADCLAAPAASVVTDADGHTVVAVVAGDQASQTPVQIGLREGDWVEIRGPGLHAGDTVVTLGAYGLPKQTKIHVVSP